MSGTVQTANQVLPQDLQDILTELDRTDLEAQKLVSGLSEQQLNWQPEGGGWSVAQCLAHLAQLNAALISAMRTGVAAANRSSVTPRKPLQPGRLGRWFIKQMEPPPRQKMKTPRQGIPQAGKNGAEVLSAFISAHNELRSLIRESRELDLNRIRFRNPFLGLLRYSVATGLLVIVAHDRRHLWQANRVQAAMKS